MNESAPNHERECVKLQRMLQRDLEADKFINGMAAYCPDIPDRIGCVVRQAYGGMNGRILLPLCAAVIFPCLSGSHVSAQQAGTFGPGPGATMCSDFPRQYDEPVASFTGLSYVLGFVSGAAIFSGEDKMHDFKSNFDVAKAVKTYCSAHPEDQLVKAARWRFSTRGGLE
jgi:hypothetical protein